MSKNEEKIRKIPKIFHKMEHHFTQSQRRDYFWKCAFYCAKSYEGSEKDNKDGKLKKQKCKNNTDNYKIQSY